MISSTSSNSEINFFKILNQSVSFPIKINNIIFNYVPHDLTLTEFNEYATSLFNDRFSLPTKEEVKELILHLASSFVVWLLTPQRKEQDLAATELVLQRNIQKKYPKIYGEVRLIFMNFKQENITVAPLLKEKLKKQINGLYVLRKFLVLTHDLYRKRNEYLTYYHLLPKCIKPQLNKDFKPTPPTSSIKIVTQIQSAENIAFMSHLSNPNRFLKDPDFEESFTQLKELAYEVSLTLEKESQAIYLHHAYELLYFFHFYTIFLSTADVCLNKNGMFEGAKLELNTALEDRFLPVFCPEIIELLECIKRKEKTVDFDHIERSVSNATKRCIPYNRFMENIEIREFCYHFLHKMFQKIIKDLSSERHDSPPKPESFKKLVAAPFLLQRQIKEIAQGLIDRYLIPLPVSSSLTSTKKLPPPSIKIKKAKKDPFAEFLSKSEKTPQISKTDPKHDATPIRPASTSSKQRIVSGEQARKILFAQRTPLRLTYADRVKSRILAPAIKGKNREDSWAHGFTLDLDAFLGTSYAFSRRMTQKKESQHCFIVHVDDPQTSLESMLYIATYTIRDDGTCYHRCLQRLSRFPAFNEKAEEKIFELTEWPYFPPAQETTTKMQSEGTFALDTLSKIVTVHDKKHGVVFKVIPWQ